MFLVGRQVVLEEWHVWCMDALLVAQSQEHYSAYVPKKVHYYSADIPKNYSVHVVMTYPCKLLLVSKTALLSSSTLLWERHKTIAALEYTVFCILIIDST